jgi:hypothetical protein
VFLFLGSVETLILILQRGKSLSARDSADLGELLLKAALQERACARSMMDGGETGGVAGAKPG